MFQQELYSLTSWTPAYSVNQTSYGYIAA